MLLAVLVEDALDGAVKVGEARTRAALAVRRGIEVVALVVAGAAFADGLAERGHLDGGERGFGALVAALQAGAVDGLLEGVAGEDAVGVGDAGLLRGLADAARDLGGDVLVVRGVAAQD